MNRLSTFEQKAIKNGINIQCSRQAGAKVPVKSSGISDDVKEEVATMKESGHFTKNSDILSTDQDFNQAYVGMGNQILADCLHSSLDGIIGNSNKNSSQDLPSEVLKNGTEIQKESIWKEDNIVKDKDRVADSFTGKKCAALQGKVCVQGEKDAGHSGQRDDKVAFDRCAVDVASVNNDVDEVDGTLPQKTSSNKQLAQEIMESIFDMAYCKAKTNSRIGKEKSAMSGNWSTWSVHTDCEDNSSIYSTTNNHLKSSADSTQRSQAFCRDIVLDTISKSCNLAENASPRSQKPPKKMEYSPSPLSRRDISVKKLSPLAAEFTPSLNLERDMDIGRPRFTDAPPTYSTRSMDSLSIRPVSAVNVQPHSVECWKQKVPLSTKETQTGSHYNDILKRAITAEVSPT